MLLTKLLLNQHSPWTGQDIFSFCFHVHTMRRPRSLRYHRLPSVLWSSSVLPGISSAIWLFVASTKNGHFLTKKKYFSSCLSSEIQKVTCFSEFQPWLIFRSTKIWPVDFWISKTLSRWSAGFSVRFSEKKMLLKSHSYDEGLFFQII